jgi:hypothetical protein
MNYDYSHELTYFGKTVAEDTYYQFDFCRVFLCKEYTDNVVKIQDEMFEKFQNNKKFCSILDAGKKNGLGLPIALDDKTVFTFLFSYDFFHYIHKCLQDLFKNNDISTINYDKLINLLKK